MIVAPEVPDVVATELRVVAVTVALLPRLKPRLLLLLLLTLFRLAGALATGGAAETVLEEEEDEEEEEKVLAEEWRPAASLSTLVCCKQKRGQSRGRSQSGSGVEGTAGRGRRRLPS